MTASAAAAAGTRLRLRTMSAEDIPFLRSLYASTRADELALTNWDDAMRATFVEMQFRAQHTHYTTHYPEAQYDIVQLDEVDVGRLYVRRGADEIVLMDIALLPEYRNRGLGSELLRALLEEASASKRPVTLHVEVNNPRALAWYRRFGFVEVSASDVHTFMRWSPAN